MSDAEVLKRRLQREKAARAEAERLLEYKSLELFEAAEKLKSEVEQRSLSEAQLTEAIENMSEGFVVYDDNDRLMLWNSRNLEIYSDSADLFVKGAALEDILRASAERGQYAETDDAEDWVQRRLELYRNPNGPFVELLSNGRWVQVSERKTSDGRTIGVRTDITELKKRESEQAELESQLRQAQKMDALGTLAGGTAHEFNNMLVPMIGLTELVMEDLPEGSLEHENLGKVLEAGERARLLVKQILTFCREQQRSLERIDLNAVTQEAVELLKNTISKSIDIQLSVPDAEVWIWADATEMHQIYMNLVTNAAHAIEGGNGKIDVTLAVIETMVGAGGGDSKRYAQIRVRDNGCGMDEETKQRVFEPFFTTKPVGEGTGLGMSVIHAIITRAEGKVTISSEPGRGTEFEILYPIFEGKAEEDEAAGMDSAA